MKPSALRNLALSAEDDFPRLYNWARYVKHVVINQAMTYPPTTRKLFRIIGSERLAAIDAGANKGIFSRYLANYFAVTHAIEPQPVLARRLARLAPARIIVHACALGDSDGEIQIRIPLDSTGGRMDALATASAENELGLFDNFGVVEEKVPLRRLDTIIPAEPAVGFIKIDVEGFEDPVIAGGAGLIARDRPLIVMEIGLAHNKAYRNTLDRIAGHGYQGFAITNAGLLKGVEEFVDAQPVSLQPSDAESQTHQWDFLFIPSEQLERFSPLYLDDRQR